MPSVDKDANMPTITHINELPSEVLAHLFSICNYEKDNCTVLLELALVCKHWHDVLWAFPRFWTSQSLTVPMKLKNSGPHAALLPRLCNHLERWYGRAGDVPRELSLSLEKANTKTAVLYKYFTNGTRWKTLSFSSSLDGASNWSWLEGLFTVANYTSLVPDPKTGEPKPCWPDLERLEIVSSLFRYDPGHLVLPLDNIAPNLTHLKIHICQLRASVFSIFASSPNPFANLTTFDFQGELGTESLGFYVHLLSTAPKLEILRALDGQHDFDVARALPKQYAKLVPVRHDALREVIMHWSPNVAVLLKSIALPGLKTLDLSRSYDPGNIARPSKDETPVAHAVQALILNSTNAAMEMGTSFALKRLSMEKAPLVVADQYEVVVAVREMVEELVLDRSACWWNEPGELYARLDKLANGESVDVKGGPDIDGAEGDAREAKKTEPLLDLFPNLKTFITTPSGYHTLSFTVSRSDLEEYNTFKASPLAWWKKCQDRLGKIEATFHDDSDDWGSGASSGDGEWDEDLDEGDDDGEWEDADEDGEMSDEDEDEGGDAIGTWQLATMSMAPTPYYGD